MGCRSSKQPEKRVRDIQMLELVALMRTGKLTAGALRPKDTTLHLPSVPLTQTGWTLLHIACWYGFSDAVKTLISAGHDPRIKDLSGRVAKDLAELGHYTDCAELLGDSNDDIVQSLFYQRNKALLLDETQQSTEMTSRSVMKAMKPEILYDTEY